MTEVTGRTVLVTGAASGIGRLLALLLAARDARMVLWDVDGEALDLVAKEVRGAGGRAATYLCDVGDPDHVRATASRVHEDVGPVDVLVNNAGVVSGRFLLDLSEQQIERTFAVNALAHFWTTRAFLPAMLESGSGHVVTIASVAGLFGVRRMTAYSASKHAAVGFADALRMELARTAPRLRTTLVCTGYVDTGMFQGARVARFPWLVPNLPPEDVAARVARAIERDEPRVLMPPIVHVVPLVLALPFRWGDKVRDVLGVSASMDHFVGRSA
jgi:all-trans-retinol dehydrogenase (NAD+)